MFYYVYVIESIKDGKFYIGCTSNVDRRLKEHNKGLSKYTKNFRPWMLKYTESFDELSLARRREKQLKSWKKRSAIERLFHGPIV